MNLRALSILLPAGTLVALVATTACESDECCPVSETFTCTNFQSGGTRSANGGSCPSPITDNVPKMLGKKVDASGCTYWEPDPSGARTCGAASTRDASTASADARDD